MAYLDDVPKYGFGTSFELTKNTNDDDDNDNDENKTTEEEFVLILERAIELGCRHIDCAPLYNTQPLVGKTLKEFLKTIPRSEFFITSKLPVNMMKGENVEKSLKNTLQELQLSYLDLFLIHAPFATKHIADDQIYPLDNEGNILIEHEDGLLEETWRKLIDLKRNGLVKYIGLSNININQLDRMNAIHKVDVLQNEYHIYNSDKELFDYCEEKDVHFEAYAPFGCPSKMRLLNRETFYDNEVVKRIASEHNISEAQVMIGWLHQQPLSYVIKTDNIQQLEENWKATKTVNLTLDDTIYLDGLNKNQRTYLYDNYTGLIDHPEYPFR